MAEDLHNDNLERFFKENLERYSPSPSGDFWARMEQSIPPKPSPWRGYASKYLKWVGLGLLLLTLATVFMLWRKDRQRIEQLSKQIAIAQQQVQQLADRQSTTTKEVAGEAISTQNALAATANHTAAPNDLLIESNRPDNRFVSPSSKGQEKSQPTTNHQLVRNDSNLGNPNLSNGQQAATMTKLADNQLITEKESVKVASDEAVNAKIGTTATQASKTNEIAAQTEAVFNDPAYLPFAYATVSSIKNQAPSVKHHGIKPNRKPYPRISYESGAAAFAMPLAHLFNRDTNYAGSIRPSWNGGFAINYDLSPSFSLQVGYQFKNIRTSKMALRYHSIPLMLVQKKQLGRRLSVEGKAGLVINKFYNRRTYSDGLSVRGRKDLWLGWQSSLQLGIPFGENVMMLVGPYGGTGITSFANGKRTWEAGLSTNIRYQF